MAQSVDPLSTSFPSKPPAISLKTFHIAGILTDVFGLEELPEDCKSVSCLWLLHPRNGTKERMTPFAAACITDWQKRRPSDSKIGLIAVAFDQRNHGTRNVHQLANESWREGNDSHAQDMFSVFHGTALDTSLLIDHLGSYIFHGPDALPIEQHLVAGVSLGGHAAWQLFFNEPRITSVVVIIGCPDYARVMKDRARLSKRKLYLATDGADFFGSEDFPNALIASVQKSDPKGQLFGSSEVPLNPSESEQTRLRAILDPKIKNKKLLLCSGGADKLVPYAAGEPFIKFLEAAASGWYRDGKVYVEDKVYAKAGHEFTSEMVVDATRFVTDAVASVGTSVGRGPSKI